MIYSAAAFFESSINFCKGLSHAEVFILAILSVMLTIGISNYLKTRK
jgi:hypothetical protein